MLKTFESSTHFYILDVAEYLVNSKYGLDLLSMMQVIIVYKTKYYMNVFSDNFQYFNVFRSNLTYNYMDNYDSIPILDWLLILKSTETFDYDQWICAFSASIYKQCKWSQFHELALNDNYFAESSCIPFIRLLLKCEENHMDSIIKMLEYFFEQFKEQQHDSRNNLDDELKRVYKDKRVINIIINICECIRVANNW